MNVEPSEAARIHDEARRQWSQSPAGSWAAGDEPLGTPESFTRVEAHRYQDQPWMHDTFQYHRFAGAKVLEVGVGLGTDHLQFARAGADMSGIDLTPRSIEMTRRRFELEGYSSDLRLMDAEQLDFADGTFDAVYSFGVLHHIPSPDRAFREIARVLRPGGAFLGALYSRESAFWWRLMVQRHLTLPSRREPLEDLLARIETGADDARPKVQLYGREELRTALQDAGFARVALKRRHLGLKRLEPLLGSRLAAELGRRAGWYLVHEARVAG